MRRSTLVTLLLVALVVTSGLAAAKARGSPELTVFAPDDEVAPGQDLDFEIYVQNAGQVAYADNAADQARVTTARDVVVTLEADDAPVEVSTGPKPVGNVPEGVSSAIPFSISVDENAEPGEYTLPIEIEYRYTNQVSGVDGVHSEIERTRRTSVTLVVEDDARFQIVDASAEDLFATSGPITLSVENVGSATARNANVAIQSGSGQLTFGDSPTAETYVGEWAPGEVREITVEGNLAAGADRRSYPLTATVNYENVDGESTESDAMTTGVTPRVDSRFSIEDVESSLVVGEEGTVTGTLSNGGNSVARNAVLVLSADTRNVEPIETEYSIGDLQPGSSTEFAYDVEVSEAAADGPRQLSFTVRYRDRNNEVRESDPLDARIDVGPDRDVIGVDPVNATLQVGGNGQLSLRVTNQGDEPITDVSAKLFANTPLSTSDDEAFVDRLEPGQTERIVFGVSASGSAMEKTYPVSLDFQYDDADGDTLLSDTYQVPVSVSAPEDDGGLPIPLIVVTVIVLAGAGYLVYRRRTPQ